MRLTTLRLTHTSAVRELQGTIRANGCENADAHPPAVATIETIPEGIMVTGHQGQRWLVSPLGVGDVMAQPVPPPMPVTTQQQKGRR